jgi:outer membrane biosynthesis protein TonB
LPGAAPKVAPTPPPADPAAKPNGVTPDKEKQKKKDRKDRKDKEKSDASDIANASSVPEPSTSSADASKPVDADDLKSPVTDGGSGGARTPKGTKPQRNPWTIFMRMTVAVTDAELREFFGEAQSGVSSLYLLNRRLNTY